MAVPLSEVVTVAIENRGKEAADNITNNNPLLFYVKKRGNKKPISGGTEIRQELSYAENGTAGWYSDWQLLNTTFNQTLTSPRYNIKQAAVAIGINGLEQHQVMGKEQFIDLLEARVNVGVGTLENLVEVGLFSDGTAAAGKQIDGLKQQVAADPTVGTVGGIDRSVETWWRNQVFDFTSELAASSTSNIIQGLTKARNKAVRGNDAPDLAILDNDYYDKVCANLQALQRGELFMAREAEVGFDQISLIGMKIVLGGGLGGAITTQTGYLLNTKYIHYRPHMKREFARMGDARTPINQDGIVQFIAWMGNLTMSGAKFQVHVKE